MSRGNRQESNALFDVCAKSFSSNTEFGLQLARRAGDEAWHVFLQRCLLSVNLWQSTTAERSGRNGELSRRQQIAPNGLCPKCFSKYFCLHCPVPPLYHRRVVVTMLCLPFTNQHACACFPNNVSQHDYDVSPVAASSEPPPGPPPPKARIVSSLIVLKPVSGPC